jgi:hypothetical protein
MVTERVASCEHHSFCSTELEASQVPNPNASKTMSDAEDETSPRANYRDTTAGEVTALSRFLADLTVDKAACSVRHLSGYVLRQCRLCSGLKN